MTQFDVWMLVATLVMASGTALMAILMWADRSRRADVAIAPQPLAVKIIEEIHERFAAKKEFVEHVKENSARHAQIFNRIDTVRDMAREELERRIDEVQLDRRRTMEKLSETFTEIRADLVAIKTELKIRNE